MEIFNNLKFLENNIEDLSKSTNVETFETLVKSIDTDNVFSGECIKCSSKGDLTVRVGDVNCIIKRSEVTPVVAEDGLVHKAICQNKVGKILKFKIKSIDKNIVYASRKSVVSEIRDYYASNLKEGQKVVGVITNIDESIGCFVDIGGDYSAMIPTRLLEHVFVNKITDHVKINDVVECIVKSIQNINGDIKITLSRVDALPPYSELTKEFEVGDVVVGVVNEITPKSIFAQLNKHLNVSCRLSTKIRVVPGQKVRIKIKTAASKDNNRISGEILSVL